MELLSKVAPEQVGRIDRPGMLAHVRITKVSNFQVYEWSGIKMKWKHHLGIKNPAASPKHFMENIYRFANRLVYMERNVNYMAYPTSSFKSNAEILEDLANDFGIFHSDIIF